MNINLHIRTEEGERIAVGQGDPGAFLQSLRASGVSGEFEIVGQWFYDESDSAAGFEAIIGGEA